MPIESSVYRIPRGAIARISQNVSCNFEIPATEYKYTPDQEHETGANVPTRTLHSSYSTAKKGTATQNCPPILLASLYLLARGDSLHTLKQWQSKGH